MPTVRRQQRQLFEEPLPALDVARRIGVGGTGGSGNGAGKSSGAGGVATVNLTSGQSAGPYQVTVSATPTVAQLMARAQMGAFLILSSFHFQVQR